MQILGTSYLLLVLCCWAAGRLSEETIRFAEGYFTYKAVRAITSFTCSKHGTNTLDKSPMTQDGVVSLLHPLELRTYGYIEMYSKVGIFRRLEMQVSNHDQNSASPLFSMKLRDTVACRSCRRYHDSVV